MPESSDSRAPAIEDYLALAGAGLLSYGAWSIYEPAGFLTAGALLVAAAILKARAG